MSASTRRTLVSNAFTQSYGFRKLDASVLPIRRGIPVGRRSPNGVTVRAIEKRLSRDGFVRRYATETRVDGLPGDEASFLACSFWLADDYALREGEAEAEEMFGTVTRDQESSGPPRGRVRPVTGRQIGNFPQGFSPFGADLRRRCHRERRNQAASTETRSLKETNRERCDRRRGN